MKRYPKFKHSFLTQLEIPKEILELYSQTSKRWPCSQTNTCLTRTFFHAPVVYIAYVRQTFLLLHGKKELLMARLENLKIVPFSNFLLSYVIYTIQDFYDRITIAFYVHAQFTSRFISSLIPETFPHENDLGKWRNWFSVLLGKMATCTATSPPLKRSGATMA